MKRMVALLLTCVLLCAPVFAFRDDGDIGAAYRKAVNAMAERGVLAGFTDGSYHPNETLTREQGAKIVAYLCLGKDAADALRSEKAPFDDVAQTRWSAPCIAWCADNGILHGYGNGRFGPTDTLTGDQFAKMLLCAMGFAREGNYANVGGKWNQMVREDARRVKLYDGDAAMESDKAITRAQAALLGWNTSQAKDAANKSAAAPSPSGSGGSGGGFSGGSGSGSSTQTPEPPLIAGESNELPMVP